MSVASLLGMFATVYWLMLRSDLFGCRSLKIFGLMCHQSEKLVQLTRVILHETREHQSSRFILYFATCASVDYFYRVRNFFNTIHIHRPHTWRCRSCRCFYQKPASFSHSTVISLLPRGRGHWIYLQIPLRLLRRLPCS